MLYISHIRAAVRAAACLAWFAVLIPVQAINLALRLNFARKWPISVYRIFNRLLGIKLVVDGKPEKNGLCVRRQLTPPCGFCGVGRLLEASFVARRS